MLILGRGISLGSASDVGSIDAILSHPHKTYCKYAGGSMADQNITGADNGDAFWGCLWIGVWAWVILILGILLILIVMAIK